MPDSVDPADKLSSVGPSRRRVIGPLFLFSFVVAACGATVNALPHDDGGVEALPQDSGTDWPLDAEREANGPKADAGAAEAGPTSLCPKRSDPSVGAPFSPAPSDVNGARIHARYVNGSDGSRFLWSLHDVALDVDCGFVNGGSTCEPHTTQSPERFFDETLLFATSDCSGASGLWGVDHGAPPPLRAGARVTTTYRLSAGVCKVAPPNLYEDYYQPGSPVGVSPVTFTLAAPTAAPGEPLMRVGSDGSSFWLGDVATYGSVGTASFNGLLLPAAIALPVGTVTCAADASDCSHWTPCAADASVCTISPEVFSIRGGGSSKLVTLENDLLRSSIGPLPAARHSIAGQSYCNATYGYGTEGEIFSCLLSPAVDDSGSPAVAGAGTFQVEPCSTHEFVTTTQKQVGGTQLSATSYAYGPQAVAAPAQMPPQHSGFGTCFPRVASDGVLRCMPGFDGTAAVWGGPYAPYHHSDSQCSQPVLPASAPVGTLVGRWANQRYSVHTVSGPITPSQLFYLDGATCSSVPVPNGWSFSALSAELPPSTFVDVTIAE